MRAAVVGHVEWVHFVRVDRMPTAGEIVHASASWEEPAGGGAGAAVQLLKLCGDATFYTALGRDDIGARSRVVLEERGLRVEAATRNGPTRRAVTHVDGDGERTITVVGDRLGPSGEADDLPWSLMDGMDAVYFTAGDVASLRHARRARVVVATSRVLPLLAKARIRLDAVVGSSVDPSEAYVEGAIDPAPAAVVLTNGAAGGTVTVPGKEPVPFPAPPLPGPVVDRYGAGDAFAAGLTYGLARGLSPLDAAAVAGRCGAAVLTGRGPYEGQLRHDDLL